MEELFVKSATVRKRGELLGTPEKDNQQPSQIWDKGIWKVQRLGSEPNNKLPTSAPSDNKLRYSLTYMATYRSGN